MNSLANSSRTHCVPVVPAPVAPGWPRFRRFSAGLNRGALSQAAIASLLPAMLGLVFGNLFAGHYGWGLGLFAVYFAVAGPLMFQTPWPPRFGLAEWLCLAIGAGVTIAISAPTVLPWLLLPVLPALLLRSARRHGSLARAVPLIHVFSVAALAAVLMQLADGDHGIGVIIAVLGAALMGLAALERLMASERDSHCRPGPRPT